MVTFISLKLKKNCDMLKCFAFVEGFKTSPLCPFDKSGINFKLIIGFCGMILTDRLLLPYKDQPVNIVQGNNCCFVLELHGAAHRLCGDNGRL
jgi:hypothetical protein